MYGMLIAKIEGRVVSQDLDLIIEDSTGEKNVPKCCDTDFGKNCSLRSHFRKTLRVDILDVLGPPSKFSTKTAP